jgi:HEAT repeat protein
VSRRLAAGLTRAAAVAAVLACRAVEGGQAGVPAKPPARRTSPAPAPARATPSTAAPSSTAPTAADRAARDGRAALERGDAAKALELVEPVIAREPAHPLAAAVKVDALLGLGERTRALDAYDAWFNIVRAEDAALLGRIAVAELEALQAEPLLQIDALAALSTQPGPRGTRARTQLTEFATADPPSSRTWPAIVALCRLGDPAAAKRAAQAYRDSTGSGRVTALEAVIAAGGPGAEPILRDALRVRDAMVQSTAADGASALKLKGLVPDLQQVAKTGEMFARFTAAVALAHLGASGGESLLEAGATSPAQDARLRVAGARKARGDRTWIAATRPLLESDDIAVRYQAAAMLADVDRPAAVKVLQTGTQDPNPAVRTLVADVVTKDPGTPVAELRRLLRDGVPRVRLSAAAAILRHPAPPR